MTSARSKLFLDVATELLGRGRRVRFRAEGESMYPTIRGGEAIVVEPRSPAALKIGDIALYHAPRGVTAHRVVGTEGMWFLMRGDAPGSAHEPVGPTQILGKVVGVEREGSGVDLTSRRAIMRDHLNVSISRLKALIRRGAGTCSSVWRGKRCVGLSLPLCALFLILSAGRLEANIGVYASGSSADAASGSVTFSFTVPASVPGDSYMIVGVSTHAPTAGATSITWNGTALTKINGITNNRRMELWQLQNPASGGPHNIVVTTDGNQVVAGVVILGGVKTGGPASAFRGGATTITSATGTGTTASVTVTTVAGDVVVDTEASRNTASDTVAGTGEIMRWSISNGTAMSVTGDGGTTLATTTSTTMGWTLSTSNNWALGAIAVIPQTVTAVTVSSLTAKPSAGGNLIRLQTGREVNNLGFNIYREQNGQRVKLNRSLLAGSALMGGAGTTFTAGHTRSWQDDLAGGSGSVAYWIEEIGLDGTSTWYGPVVPDAYRPSSGGIRAASRMRANESSTETDSPAQTLSSVGRAVSSTRAAGRPVLWPAAPPHSIQRQYELAQGAAVKLGVNAEGWYRVTQPQLVAAGLDPNVDPRNLQLYVNGVQQPILVEGQADGRFDARDAVQFYGQGVDTIYSDTQVYWLVAGSEAGLRISSDGPAKGPAGSEGVGSLLHRPPRSIAGSFPFTVEWEPRTLYFAALLNGDGNNFFGPVVNNTALDQFFTVTQLDTSGGTAHLQVTLQGATAGAHRVSIALNGGTLGEVDFSDQTSGTASFAATVLAEGTNTLTLASAGETDVSLVDNVQLTYPHQYIADGDYLRFSAKSSRSQTISGFTSSSIQVVDITDPQNAELLNGTVSGSSGRFSVSVTPRGAGTRTLLAIASPRFATPASVTANHPSSWHSSGAGADMVIISHQSLLSAVAPLASLRQSQGHSVKVIDVEDLYDEFSFGVKSPYAIRSFLSIARTAWSTPPDYVLLMGNGTFDPRNYLRTAVPDLVPVKLVDTSLLETASDDWFVDFNNSGVPAMAIGRIPAESVSDATTEVNRLIAYDHSGGGGHALLVAGVEQDPSDNFANNTATVRTLLPDSVAATQILAGSDVQAHADVMNELNLGQSLVNFLGHGSTEVWADGLFTSSDATALTNGTMSPIVLSMTCLNGYFQDVYSTSLAKAWLKSPSGGAVAVWASSGLTDASPQSQMDQTMVRGLYAAGNTIGKAAMAAKRATTDPDVRRTWILFGDPAMKLR